MEASLTRRSLSMAIEARRPHAKLLHHSDRGSQYSDAGFRADLNKRAAIQSMSRKANVWDNAVMESFFATLQKELLDVGRSQPNTIRGQALARGISG